MVKKQLTYSVDEKIIAKACKEEINLSIFLEIRLMDFVSNMEKYSRRDAKLRV